MPQRQHEACTVPGCGRPHKTRGYCNAHHQRFLRGVDVNVELRQRDTTPKEHCSEDGCREPVKAKSLCKMHYARLLRHGHTKYLDRKSPAKLCTAPNCEDHRYADGLCHRHYTQRKRLNDRYDMTVEDLERMRESQGDVCAICSRPNTTKNGPSQRVTDLRVDHCHATGKVRGLLCDQCNKGLGMFEDSVERMAAAIAYLGRTTIA